MAANLDLTGDTIASSFDQLLHIGHESLIGVDATGHYITNGTGTQSALSISTTRVGIATETPTTVLQVVGSFTTGLVSLTASASITATLHAGRTLVLNASDAGSTAVTLTLPAAEGTGNVYRFVVGIVSVMTAAYKIQVVANDIMLGHIVTDSLGDSNEVKNWKTATDSDTIKLNGTTKGGVQIGDWIELIDIATDKWMVFGYTTTSGTEATPFLAAVS
jgi:hypothetical protein